MEMKYKTTEHYGTPEPEMEWQPMETAPKDGSRVLVFDGLDMYVAAWNKTEGEMWVYGCVISDYNDYLEVCPVTHWMSLPDVPLGRNNG